METADRSEKIAELVETAFELEPAERINFLDRNCGDDAELRAEVESLLQFQASARNFIEAAGLSHRRGNFRRRKKATNCSQATKSAATKSVRSSAKAAWAKFIWRTTCSSAAPSRSN